MADVKRYHGDPSSKMKPKVEQCKFGPWEIMASKSHILKSDGPDREKFESSELELPQLPEMVFAENILRLQHTNGYGIEFNAFDALKKVDAKHDLMKVAAAKAWKEARQDCEHINEVVKPFDWTYTTDYSGTLFGTKDEIIEVNTGDGVITVKETTEKIDIEKLKGREKIHFYADTLLFEDELADNGCSLLSVKVRVMPNYVFILLRFYLRVDHQLIRLYDTRFYHEAGSDHILRECSMKESKVEDLKIPPHILTDPNEIGQYLKLTSQTCHRLELPQSSKDSS